MGFGQNVHTQHSAVQQRSHRRDVPLPREGDDGIGFSCLGCFVVRCH